MSEATAAPAAQPDAPARRGVGHRTFRGLLRSEWIKLWAQPATWILFGVAAVLTLGFNGIFVRLAGSIAEAAGQGSVTPDDVRGTLIVGWSFGILILGVAAIRSTTTEYASSSRASYLVAAPQRWAVVAAKTLVLAGVFVLVTIVVNLLGHLLILLLAGSALTPSFSSASYLGLFWGTAASAAIIAVFGVGIGEIVRSTAGGIVTWMVLYFVANVPLSFAGQRWAWMQWLSDHWISSVVDTTMMPVRAGAQSTVSATSGMGAGEAFVTLAAWAVVAMGFGIWRALRSDV